MAGWNVAVTVFAPVMETVQVSPEYIVHPDQVFRIESGPGSAVSVTVSPLATGSLQSPAEPVAQAIPGPVTVPVPVPVATVVSRYVAGWNVTVTLLTAVMETVQLVPVYVLQPDQLLKIESATGVAVSVTVSPFATGAVQLAPEPVVQAIPGPVTVPTPVPAVTTVSA